MAKTLSLEPIKYILEGERESPKGDQTVFHIRPLRLRERSELQDKALVSEMKTTGPKTDNVSVFRHLGGTQSRLALETGLIKIDNLLGPDGSTLKFDKNSTPKKREEILDSLHPDWVTEITGKILEISGMTKEEEKN